MAGLNGGQPQPSSYLEDGRQLAAEILQMQADLDHSIQVAGVKNDPTLPLIKVIGVSLGLQSRLLNQAVSYFHDASARLDRQFIETMRQAEIGLAAKQAVIVDQLSPAIAKTVDFSVRQNVKLLKLRTLIAGGAALLVFIVAGGAIAYGTGFAAGRQDGQNAARTIQTAMAGNPDNAAAWARLMQDNSGAMALKACQKGVATDAEGRRYCFMPVWLDGNAAVPPSQQQ
jgi:hypothetical protein